MSAVAKYVWPTTAEVRGRMRMAREIEFESLPSAFFGSENEQRLFHLARRLHQALHATLADLDLYVGKEPTQAEEMQHLSQENDRLHSALADITTVLDSRGDEGAANAGHLSKIAGIVRRVEGAGGAS